MRGTKLKQQFEALSDADLIPFRKYLAVNGNRQVRALFDYIAAHRREADELTKPMLFKKMFPKERDYNDVRLRNLMTRLGKQIDAYLVQDELQEAEELRTQLLLRAYEKRNAYPLFKAEISGRLRKLDLQQEQGISFFRERASLYHHLFFYPKTDNTSKQSKELFDQLVRSFESWFELGTLTYQSDYLVQKALTNEENPSRFFGLMLDKNASKGEDSHSPVVKLLFYLCSLSASGLDFDAIEQACKFYHEALPQMETLERKIAAEGLISKVHALIAAHGDERSFGLLFNLYKDELEMGMYVEAGRMHARVFTGIAVTGATAGYFAWTADFIKNYSQLVEETDRENAILLSNAYLDYNRGRKARGSEAGKYFGEAILALSRILHGPPEFELRVRSLQLRIFYDHDLVLRKNEQLIKDFSKSFRQYLRNLDSSRLSNLRVNAYLDFIRYTLKLAQLHSPNAKKPQETLQKIIQDIEHKSTQVMLRHWLMEKAEELKKKLLRQA